MKPFINIPSFILMILVLVLSMGVSISKVSCPMGSSLYLALELPSLDQTPVCSKMASKSHCPLRAKKQKKVSKQFQFDFETFVSGTDKIEVSEITLKANNPVALVCYNQANNNHLSYSGIPPPLLRKPSLSLLQSFLL